MVFFFVFNKNAILEGKKNPKTFIILIVFRGFCEELKNRLYSCFVLLEICFCVSGRRRSERSHGSAGSLRLYRQREPGQPGMVRLG